MPKATSVMVAIADPNDVEVDAASSAPAAERPSKILLSTEQCKAARQAFLQHDIDGNGVLDLQEFKNVMHAICPDIDEQQFVTAFNAIDVDGSGSIDYSEFLAAQEKFHAWMAFGFSLAVPEYVQISTIAALAAWELPPAPMPVEPPRLFITDALCVWLAQQFPWLKPVSMLNGTMATLAEVCMRGAWPLRCADAILRGSSQVMMINNPIGGLLMLGALFVPSAAPAVAGLLGLLGATLCAFALRLDAHSRQAGLFGYNGVLVGLGLATFLDGAARWDAGIFIMAPILGALSVVLQLAMGNALVPTFKLPPATLAFNLINVLIIGGSQNFARFRVADFLAPKLGAPAGATNATLAAYGYMDEPTTVTMGWALHAALVSVGQVFLCQSATSGALILAGMAVSSRIAAVAAYAGALCGVAVALALGAPLGQIGAGLWGYNATLGAANVMIFFEPTLVACIFSLVSAFLCVLFDGLLKGACAPLGLPVGTTPFCFAAFLFLLTHGKIPGLQPIPLAKVATPEEQLVSTARTETLLKNA